MANEYKIMQLNVKTGEYNRVYNYFSTYEEAKDFFNAKIVKAGDCRTTYVGDDMSLNGDYLYRIVEAR
jgi:hypothetical protein